MNEPIILPHDVQLFAYPARSYKSKRYQQTYICTHCRETLSGRQKAYSLWPPRELRLPARDTHQLHFDFCSEEHARLWLDDQLAQVEARNQARFLATRASLTETRTCIDCGHAFPVNGYGDLVVPFFDVHSPICERCGNSLVIVYEEDGRVSYSCPQHHLTGSGPQYYGRSATRCPRCDEERHKKNRQAYPLCPMCDTPTRVSGFLRAYHGFPLDIIRVCCKNCIPGFEALPEAEQMEWLRKAIVKTYGETAVIYALQYDDSFFCHHIGRTKRLKRRMAEYQRTWYCEIKAYHVLETLPFGGLSMERESRWMLHALKQGWPIDNFDMFASGKHPASPELTVGGDVTASQMKEIHEKQQRLKERLTAAVADIEPLTAPFEEIEPLIREFMNTTDTRIVHWYIEHAAMCSK